MNQGEELIVRLDLVQVEVDCVCDEDEERRLGGQRRGGSAARSEESGRDKRSTSLYAVDKLHGVAAREEEEEDKKETRDKQGAHRWECL